MGIKEKTKSKLKTVLFATLIGTLIGVLFVTIAFGFDIERAIKGFSAGFVITFLISFFEKFIFSARFKKLNFSIVLAIRTFYYIIVISVSVMTVWVIHESIVNNRGFIDTIETNDFSHFMTKGDFPTILLFSQDTISDNHISPSASGASYRSRYAEIRLFVSHLLSLP